MDWKKQYSEFTQVRNSSYPNSLSGDSHNSGVIDWSTKKSLATGVGNNSPSIEWLSGVD